MTDWLQMVANIAQVAGVVWAFFLGGKTIFDIWQTLQKKPFHVSFPPLALAFINTLSVSILVLLLIFNHSFLQPPAPPPTTHPTTSTTVKTLNSQQQEEIFQMYRGLIIYLAPYLHNSHPKDDVRNNARQLTLTSLSEINGTQKREIMKVLYANKLIGFSGNNEVPIISLAGADLSNADLSDTDLSNANLINANLTNANLTNANLAGALLRGAIITGANHTATINADSE